MDGMLGSADCNWSVTIDNHGHIMVYPICKSYKSLVFLTNTEWVCLTIGHPRSDGHV